MRVLLDTNVLLDALLARPPFVRDAARIFALAERQAITGLVSAISVPTVHYVISRARDAATADGGVNQLLRLFEVASVGRAELPVAAAFPDYEDGVIHASAVAAQADGLVTRDGQGFGSSTVRVYSPGELLAALAAT